MNEALANQILELSSKIQTMEKTEQHDILIDQDLDDDRHSTTSTKTIALSGDKEKAIFAECKRTFASAMLFDASTDFKNGHGFGLFE